MVYTGISICSGVGGLELGLKCAVPTAIIKCCVEREAYAIGTLNARMQDKWLDPAPMWPDLRTFDGKPWRGKVDFIVGGYPCQPFSIAGKGKGKEDERWLWDDIKRIIGEVQPSLCFFENVARHLSVGFEQVANDLDDLGFGVAAGLFSAEEVGAPHQRKRLFIMAHHKSVRADRGMLNGCKVSREEGQRLAFEFALSSATGGVADTHGERPNAGQSGDRDLREAEESGVAVDSECASEAPDGGQCAELANAGSGGRGAGGGDFPKRQVHKSGQREHSQDQRQGDERESGVSTNGSTGQVGNAKSKGPGDGDDKVAKRHLGSQEEREHSQIDKDGGRAGAGAGGRGGDVAHAPRERGERAECDRDSTGQPQGAIGNWGGGIFPPKPSGDWTGIEDGLKPQIHRGADGMADWLDRLVATGNGVVPLCAADAFISLSVAFTGESTPTNGG